MAKINPQIDLRGICSVVVKDLYIKIKKMKALYLWIGLLLIIALIVFVYQQNQQQQKRGVQDMNEHERILSQRYAHYSTTQQSSVRKINAERQH